ncbi:hypothetical protein [Erythrobacter aureus]|uniref:Uncharacterized protein n=1 Tax=Erythrobacter aureus TaxID=2182384 RepID=A0A345YIT3_9SPHN|nr:hypothetical protein [Erythrobacter aureus]AXK43835.1 hypothetical protein DVR09_15380 [Erythrobacter aureus]
MKLNPVRRLEKLESVGGWSVGTNNTDVLIQLTGAAPECEMERLRMTPYQAQSFARDFSEMAHGRLEHFPTHPFFKGNASVRALGKFFAVRFKDGVASADVEVLFARYDLWEFAKAIFNQAVDIEVSASIAAAELAIDQAA